MRRAARTNAVRAVFHRFSPNMGSRFAGMPATAQGTAERRPKAWGIGQQQFVLLWLFLQVFRPNDKIEPTDLQAAIACTLRHCDAQVRVAPVGCLILWGKFFSMEPSEQKGDNFNAAWRRSEKNADSHRKL